MKPGKLALLRFPHVDLEEGKLRPVLLIAPVPGNYPDWLVAMVSSRLEQAIPGFDEIIKEEDPDFVTSGLKRPSVIRIGDRRDRAISELRPRGRPPRAV
jgi:mRNA interferase MazF